MECGSECSRTNVQKSMSKLSKYKFYLSFENNYCCDYLSEKIILNAFESDIIPDIISYVDFNDTSLIPPGSAIKFTGLSISQRVSKSYESCRE